ncbi:hypothetical protein SISNIDRAFT_111796 [Sistotremastrum niveocremeum HHB9708]|uniref:C2H2-type domain-containing protein n=1 Tax=Sistotremastrum niveocremeum HHB9708 TaxID=1314777 RepID=A0A164TI90_9AGAM|nr:hypothetical protein SISNIDRAFT_111796 [Sistotremastrum niveocremeum HHB9708]
MNMSSRNVESSSVGTTPQPTEKQLRDAIALILRSLQRGPSALIGLPDFKQLVAIVANVPSSQVGPYNKSNAVALNRTQATPSCVECGQCGEMFVNANDHDKHVREAHFVIPKGHLCNICQKYFNTAANLHLVTPFYTVHGIGNSWEVRSTEPKSILRFLPSNSAPFAILRFLSQSTLTTRSITQMRVLRARRTFSLHKKEHFTTELCISANSLVILAGELSQKKHI